MQVPDYCAESLGFGAPHFAPPDGSLPAGRQYNTRQTPEPYGMLQAGDATMNEVYESTELGMGRESLSPTKMSQPPGKHVVTFELIHPDLPERKARLPLKVELSPHDTTGSIILTVKNFYALWGCGIVFEDAHQNTLIASYANLSHNMTVFVRTTEEAIDDYGPDSRHSNSPRRARREYAHQMLPPALGSRTAHRPSHSPQPGRGRRSVSASTNNKSRTRPLAKSRGTSSHGSFAEANGDANYYSDSDGGNGSVSSSRRARKEQLASADISVDNIVEGGRRKRAKFDSSELPLFVPPQIPKTASLSSVSPQRRIGGQHCASPYSATNQHTFAFSHSMQSPQSNGQGEVAYLQGLATPYTTSNGKRGFESRSRNSAQYSSYRVSGFGMPLPTPDSTLGNASIISDEDVARQLMRLGDHGRTTTASPLDDAFSGKAEVSSCEESDGSDDEPELPPLVYPMARPQGRHNEFPRTFESGDTSGEEYEDNRDASFKGESDEPMLDEHRGHQVQISPTKGRASVSVNGKSGKTRAVSKGKGKPVGASKPPMSPTSLPPQSRKASTASINFQHQLGVDEEDLSSKPRCQRCRKSKKGCDRQRPCQRCKDAGIGIEGCVSEDEGNGRKGRYGRHMGVPVKKEALAAHEQGYAGSISSITSEKNKKRKR